MGDRGDSAGWSATTCSTGSNLHAQCRGRSSPTPGPKMPIPSPVDPTRTTSPRQSPGVSLRSLRRPPANHPLLSSEGSAQFRPAAGWGRATCPVTCDAVTGSPDDIPDHVRSRSRTPSKNPGIQSLTATSNVQCAPTGASGWMLMGDRGDSAGWSATTCSTGSNLHVRCRGRSSPTPGPKTRIPSPVGPTRATSPRRPAHVSAGSPRSPPANHPLLSSEGSARFRPSAGCGRETCPVT